MKSLQQNPAENNCFAAENCTDQRIRKREMAKDGLENRTTAVRKGGPAISRPVGK